MAGYRDMMSASLAMPVDTVPDADLSAAFRRGSSPLWIAVLASAMLHVVALGWLPGLEHVVEHAPLPLRVLLAPRIVDIPASVQTAVQPAPTLRTDQAVRSREPAPKYVEPATVEPVLAAPAPIIEPAAVPAAPPARVERSTPAPVPEPVQVQQTLPDPQVLAGYGRSVAGAVAVHQRYPRVAQLRQWQGTTTLRLEFAADGRLLKSSVLSSSGHEVLDRQAQEMLRAALPLPPLPPNLVGRPLVVNVPVVFRLAG